MFFDQFSELKKSDLFDEAKIIPEEKIYNGKDQTKSTATETTNKNVGSVFNHQKTSSTILVNPSQRGNPLLKSVTSVPWEYDGSIIPDYVMGRTTCALFLSLRYHNLKPNYINERLKQLKKLYDLRVLLVQVDLQNPHHTLKHLTRICLLADLTLMVAWNAEEAGRIIETYKIYEHKPPDMIMEKQDSDPRLKIINALTSVRSVNRTDAATLLSTFGTLSKVIGASKESLSLCSGLGPQKASRLYTTLRQPFLKSKKRSTSPKKESITDFLKKPKLNPETPSTSMQQNT